MAITIDNLFAAGFSGKVGNNMVFRKRKSGKIVIAKAPKKSTVPPSKKQLELRSKFAKGTQYAKVVRANPGLYELYALAVKDDQTPTNVAIRDLYTPPQIESIDISDYSGAKGREIVVHAVDDFKVAQVYVTILSNTGAVIEEGDARQKGNTDYWVYTTTVLNKYPGKSSVKATAVDLPGNQGVFGITIG